nr:sugar O-acetyltransferase [Algoriphagus sp.]
MRLKNLTEAKARFQSGEVILPTDPAFAVIMPIVGQTLKLVGKLNSSGDIAEAREILSHIFDQEVDESTTVFPPFTTNFGRFTKIGKQVFINHGCSFLDLGGITIEDEVLIGPQVKLVTENH